MHLNKFKYKFWSQLYKQLRLKNNENMLKKSSSRWNDQSYTYVHTYIKNEKSKFILDLLLATLKVCTVKVVNVMVRGNRLKWQRVGYGARKTDNRWMK